MNAPTPTETDLLINNTELSGRERAASRWVTIEPVAFLAPASYIMAILLRVQYVLVRVQEVYNYTGHAESPCEGRNQSANSTHGDIQARIQADSARWLLLFSLVGMFPGFASAIVFGSLSDRVGRKVFLFVSAMGSALFAGISVAVMALHLPLEVFYAAEVAVGLTGGQTLILAVCFSYIADITTQEQRTFRIVVVEAVFFLIGFAQIGIEYSVEAIGFAPTAGVAVGLAVLALVYIICPGALIETIDRTRAHDGPEPICEKLSLSLRHIVRLFRGHGDAGRIYRLALLFATGFALTITISSLQIFILYTEAEPFCWSPVTIGYYVALRLTTMTIGNIVGFKVLARCLRDHSIFQISCFCSIIINVVNGFAKTTLTLFLGLGVGMFGGLCFPVVRSSLSKLVRADEQGSAFSLFACVENLGLYVSPIVLNAVYIATVSSYPPTVFFVIAGVTFVPSLLFGIFHICRRTDNSLSVSAVTDSSPEAEK